MHDTKSSMDGSNLRFKANIHEGPHGICIGHKLRNAIDYIHGLPMHVTGKDSHYVAGVEDW